MPAPPLTSPVTVIVAECCWPSQSRTTRHPPFVMPCRLCVGNGIGMECKQVQCRCIQLCFFSVKILTLFSGHRSLSLYRNPRFWGWAGLEQCQRRCLLQKPNLLGPHSISNLFSSHLFKIVHATPLPPTPAANQNVQRSTAQCSCVPLLCCCHRRCRRHRSTSILSQQIKSTRGWGRRS